ncbi:MAG: uracil-DNA glycosylase [Polyangiaceae bacterium]
MKSPRADVALGSIAEQITSCRRCERLVAHRELVAREKRAAYRDEAYWGRPVPGFGDPRARLLLVGLAPGAHGANRTGRAFTGDRSGDFLYAALHRAGLASQPSSSHRGDGLSLRGVFITLPVRCAPPDNKPSREEIAACFPFFEREVAALSSVRAILALGAIALASVARLTQVELGFEHGASGRGRLAGRPCAVFASYHVSQQNTQTGRLTAAMFDDVLHRAWAAASLK